MPIENDDGGGSGGGSTTNICTINPSDNVSVINNLISRISDIEKFLSQLVGADVHADNLSELAENIGNILNGTITLPSDDNSPYGQGGSIPVPDDFTGMVISGNTTVIWENGVVSFQVDYSNGLVTGGSTRVNSFNGSDITNYTIPGAVKVLKNFTAEHSDGIVTQSTSTGAITLSSTGLYLVGYTMSASLPAGVGADKRFLHGFGDGSGWYANLSQSEAITGQSGDYKFSGNYFFRNDGSPNVLYLQCDDNGVSGSTRSVEAPSLFIVKLKGL